MQIKVTRPSPALALAFILGLLLFALDVGMGGLHLWARYLLPLFIVYFWGRPRELYLTSVFLSLLMVASFWLEALAGAARPLDAFTDHLLPLLVLWVFAWLSVQRRRVEEDLKAQVQARTAELAANEQRYRLLAENATDVVWAREEALAGLRRSEERFAKLFRSSPAGIALTRRDGTYLDANDVYLAMTGYTRRGADRPHQHRAGHHAPCQSQGAACHHGYPGACLRPRYPDR